MKLKHGQYLLKMKKGFYLFNSYLKIGRALLNDGQAKDFTYKTHPKIVKAILSRGRCGISPKEFKLKGGVQNDNYRKDR